MKIFISQPMGDKTMDEILDDRNQAIEKLKKSYPDVEIIDSFIIESAPESYTDPGVFYILKSLELLSDADLAVFLRGWDKYRGCRVEHEFAKNYGIEIKEE